MAAMSIYSKNLSKIISRTGGLIFTRLGMWYLGFEPITLCTNYDPGLTLIIFTGKVKLCDLGFPIEKSESNGFLDTIAACDMKV